jgi:tetrahedral aminopeptidase
MFDLIKMLCELPGPGGDEWAVQEFISQRWASRVQSLHTTRVGNVVAHLGGSGPRLLVAAHADELCYVVKHIGPDGFIFITNGQRDDRQRPFLRGPVLMPWGQPALIHTSTGPVEGVFATLTGHILTDTQREKKDLDWNDLWVDIGATSRDEAAARGVAVGDRVIWNTPTRRMGQLAYGKAMDDRVALAIMDRLLDILDRDLLAYDLVFASTVQEEIGLVGAESIVQDANCEMAVSLDVGLVGDVPGVDQRDVSARLGGGPIIVHKDLSNYSRPLTLSLIKAAHDAGIPVQPAVFGLYGSDSGMFTRKGLQAALVVVPTRYTHSPFEMVHLDDVENTVQLMKHFLEAKP